MNKFFDFVLSMLFPHRCPFCGKAISIGQVVCSACESGISFVKGKTCPQCGRGVEYCYCNGKFEFERCVSPFYYDGLVRKSIISFKFRAKKAYAAAYAEFAARIIEKEYSGICFDFIACVPLTKTELKERGFNQSEVFARALSGRLNLPFKNILVKPHDVKPQRTLNSTQRWDNIADAFSALHDIGGATVLLVDDIITTGATLSDCARALKSSGAKEVFCATIACVRPCE